MANNFDSNFSRKLAARVLDTVENKRILSKNVNTQLLAGKFNPDSGENYDFKRPTDYKSSRTSDGDISATTAQSIIRGKATGTVQDYITVETDFLEADQALKMGKDENEFFDSMADRIVTDLEVDYAAYMMKNSGLLAGTPGNAVDGWDDVAEAGAVMESHGIPKDGMWCYSVNPYTQANLAGVQRSLGAADPLVSSSHQNAIISSNFAGMKVMTATTLSTYTLPATGDLVGAVNSAPTATYVGAKDTMTQSVTVDGFGSFSGTIPAGTVVKITGRNRLNLKTRQPIVNGAGANVEFTAVVTADATLTTGAGTLVISGPAIYEADGAYNTVDAAIADNDVITILGADSTMYQPNLFWHKNAFSIGFVPMQKLYSTDTIATSKDGLQMRVSKGTSIRENKQIVRIDLRPAYAVLNPFFAGQGYGKA